MKNLTDLELEKEITDNMETISLYPTTEEYIQINEQIEKVMAEIKPIIHEKIKNEISNMFDYVFNDTFDAIVESLDFNIFSSVRDRIMNGLRGYSTAKNYRDYIFVDVRKKMLEENKEEITNDYINDLKAIIKEKDELIVYLQSTY